MKNKIIMTILICFIFIDALLIYLTLTITPLKLKRTCFTFEYGEDIPTTVEDYVNANESILKSIQLNLKGVSTKVGVYQASVEYFDKVYPFEIEIVDTIKPKAQLKQVEFHIQLGEKIKASDLIKEVQDHSKTTVYFYNEETEQFVKSKSYATEGSYIERIVVKDEHGNQSAALRVKIVVESDNEKPQFIGIEDTTINVGDYFNELDGIQAYDENDGYITSRIKVTGLVDVQKAGVYEITYSVSDLSGNKITKIRKVTVKEW